MKHHIGLVLSGGGARGFAHLGVLKALEENGIQPAMISGTSAGALIGALYAANYSVEEILTIARKLKMFSFSSFGIGQGGLFSMRSFEKICKEYFPENSFEALSIPLFVATTDIINGRPVYFSSGDLCRALIASSCVPFVFKPIPYEDTLLVDGGVLNNFPIEPLEGKCKKIIGVHVNSMSTRKGHVHMRDMIDRSFHLILSNTVYTKSHQCDVFIEPPEMSRFSLFDIRPAEEIVKFSYDYTMSMMDQLAKLK